MGRTSALPLRYRQSLREARPSSSVRNIATIFSKTSGTTINSPTLCTLTATEKSSLWGTHVQDEMPIRSNLTLDLGLSYDHCSTFGSTTNPARRFDLSAP